ncbi:MAG: hypothetical protein KDI36_19740, partial [Pseudomonadales bacterium]|nr:hypothetical protein [Pseudomonadales bacterium]
HANHELARHTGDDELGQLIREMEAAVYTRDGSSNWQGQALLARVTAIRNAHIEKKQDSALPMRLNPV